MEARVLTPEELEALEELHELMERARVNDRQRFEFRAYPLVAVELLRYALARKKIRNPAAFALTRYRVRVAIRPEPELTHQELEAERLSEEDVERGLAFARSLGLPAEAIAALEDELATRSAA